jgi:RimJ/RimL family protein N-acetyltransferase
VGWARAVTLKGDSVVLEPLRAAHHDDLVEAVRDGELWNLCYTSVPTPEGMAAEIERRLHVQATGSMVAFAVVERASGRTVGMTTYCNCDEANRRLEIGYTFYRKRVQRTGLNTESKLLLLTHAFETLECIAVEFRTSSMNRQSQAAIERLGARLDGILRSHGHHSNGTLRDTYVYSITADEWTGLRKRLQQRLATAGSTTFG